MSARLRAKAEAAEIAAAAAKAAAEQAEEIENNIQNAIKYINIDNFYNIEVTNDSAVFNVSKFGMEHIVDEIMHDFHESLSIETLKFILTKSGFSGKNIVESYKNENTVLLESKQIGSCKISLDGKEKYCWVPLSNLNEFGNSDIASYETFLPLSSYEQFEKLFMVYGIDTIDSTPAQFVIDALKRNSSISSLQRRLKSTTIGFRIDTEPSIFKSLDAANVGDISTFESFALDPEPEILAVGDVSPESADEEPITVPLIKKCIASFHDKLIIELTPEFENSTYSRTNVLIRKFDQTQLISFSIDEASVSNIISKIKNYLDIDIAEKGTRKTKESGVSDKIGTLHGDKLLTVVGILLIKTLSDPLQILLSNKKVIYATFDGNNAVGLSRTGIKHNPETELYNNCILFEKSVGVMCLRPLVISYFSCFLTNISMYISDSRFKQIPSEISEPLLDFFKNLKLSISPDKNIYSLISLIIEAVRKDIVLKKQLSDSITEFNKLKGGNKEDLKGLFKEISDIFDIPEYYKERYGIDTIISTHSENGSEDDLEAKSITGEPFGFGVTQIDASNYKRKRQTDIFEQDSPSSKIQRTDNDIENRFSSIVTEYKKNKDLMKNYINQIDNTINNNISEINRLRASFNQLNKEECLKYIISLTSSFEPSEYLVYDENDLSIILTLFGGDINENNVRGFIDELKQSIGINIKLGGKQRTRNNRLIKNKKRTRRHRTK